MLQRGGREACLDDLRRADAAGDPRPAANCRLAEALFHQDRHEEAVECVRRAFPAALRPPRSTDGQKPAEILELRRKQRPRPSAIDYPYPRLYDGYYCQ